MYKIYYEFHKINCAYFYIMMIVKFIKKYDPSFVFMWWLNIYICIIMKKKGRRISYCLVNTNVVNYRHRSSMKEKIMKIASFMRASMLELQQPQTY